jgi:hypothetical protein
MINCVKSWCLLIRTKLDLGLRLHPGTTQTKHFLKLIQLVYWFVQCSTPLKKCCSVTIGIFISNFFQSRARFVQAEIVHGQKYFTLLISGLIWSQPSSGNSSILSIFIIAKQRSTRSTRSMSLWQEYVIKGLFKGHCFVLFCLKKKIRFPRC